MKQILCCECNLVGPPARLLVRGPLLNVRSFELHGLLCFLLRYVETRSASLPMG